MDFKNKRWLLLISLAAFVGFLLNLYLSASFELTDLSDARTRFLENQSAPTANQSGLADNQSRPFDPSGPFDPFFRGRIGIPVHSMFLSSALLIASVVPASYYLLSESLEQKLEMKFNVISKLVKGGRPAPASRSAQSMDDKGIVLKFLNPNERRVVGALIGKKRDVLQAEISRMEGMDKLKTHRAIKDLERKGIIVREGQGKTNRVMLTEDVRKLFE